MARRTRDTADGRTAGAQAYLAALESVGWFEAMPPAMADRIRGEISRRWRPARPWSGLVVRRALDHECIDDEGDHARFIAGWLAPVEEALACPPIDERWTRGEGAGPARVRLQATVSGATLTAEFEDEGDWVGDDTIGFAEAVLAAATPLRIHDVPGDEDGCIVATAAAFERAAHARLVPTPANCHLDRLERDLRSGQPFGDGVVALRWSADGRWLAAACKPARLLVWDATTGARVAAVTTGSDTPNGFAFVDDRRVVAWWGIDGRIADIDVAEATVREIRVPGSLLLCQHAFDPQRRTLWTLGSAAGNTATLIGWDVDRRAFCSARRLGIGVPHGLRIGPDGPITSLPLDVRQQLVAIDTWGPTGEPHRVVVVPVKGVTEVAYDTIGRRFVVVDENRRDRSIRFFRFDDATPAGEIPYPADAVPDQGMIARLLRPQFSANGSSLYLEGRRLLRVPLTGGEPVALGSGEGARVVAAVHPIAAGVAVIDGEGRIAWIGEDGTVQSVYGA